MPFNVRQESARCEQTAFGVLPADEGLGPDHFTGAQVHLGLVVKNKFLQQQCLSDTPDRLIFESQRSIVLGIKQVVTVFSGELGTVHGLVGLAQQLIGVDVVHRGVKTHAHAGRYLEGDVVQYNRVRDDFQQLLHQTQAVLLVCQIHQDGYKFITTQTCDRVAFA